MKFEDVIFNMAKFDFVEVVNYETLETIYFGKVEHLSNDYDNANIRLITAAKQTLNYVEFEAFVVIYIDWE